MVKVNGDQARRVIADKIVADTVTAAGNPVDAGHPYRCAHADVDLRRRTNSVGAETFVDQCLRCGGQARSRRKSELTASERSRALVFDESLRQRFSAQAYEQHKARQDERDVEFWTWYNAYLQSPEWHRRRDLVMRRAGGICEGCLSASATQIHHTTYAHVGEELMFELRAVCDGCHERIHAREK